MGWLYYCGLTDFDVNSINNVNMNNKRKKDYQRSNLMNVDLDDDYESSWTKYVGIDRETREKLKQNQISKLKEQINSSTRQNDDYFLRENQFKDFLTDEMILKKIESLKPKKDNIINNNNMSNDLPIFSVKSDNLNHDNNDSTESDNINTQKNYKILNNKKLSVKIPEFENIEIPINTKINFDIDKQINEKNNNYKIDDSLNNSISDNNNLIQKNLNNNNLKNNDNSNNKKVSFPLNSYRTIQISTQSPIQPNMNNQIEKNQIFQVCSVPKIKTDKKNELINQKRDRENKQNLNIFHKEQPLIMNELNNFNMFQNNNNPFNIYKGLTQTPSLFSNHSDLNNSLFKDEQFKLENFTSLSNNDISITNNEISETYLRNNINSPILNNQNNNNLNNNIIDNDNDMSIVINNNNNKNELNNKIDNEEKSNNNKKLIISKKEGKIVIKSVGNQTK